MFSHLIQTEKCYKCTGGTKELNYNEEAHLQGWLISGRRPEILRSPRLKWGIRRGQRLQIPKTISKLFLGKLRSFSLPAEEHKQAVPTSRAIQTINLMWKGEKHPNFFITDKATFSLLSGERWWHCSELNLGIYSLVRQTNRIDVLFSPRPFFSLFASL